MKDIINSEAKQVIIVQSVIMDTFQNFADHLVYKISLVCYEAATTLRITCDWTLDYDKMSYRPVY